MYATDISLCFISNYVVLYKVFTPLCGADRAGSQQFLTGTVRTSTTCRVALSDVW